MAPRHASAMLTRPGIAAALGAALLFGASTPLAKLLVGEVSPVLLAGLLYAGSGIGLGSWLLVRQTFGFRAASVPPARDLTWLGAAILSGGVLGPVLLIWGLAHTSAAATSLLLNLESVLTAALAWFVFREHFDRRILLGMLLIGAGGVLLAWQNGPRPSDWLGPVAIVAACLCWALDNNLTRKISAGDAVSIAAAKGLAAGAVNVSLGLAAGATLPRLPVLGATAAVGLFGYGVSLVLFIIALRNLGASRTGAYFATAPFIGAALALGLLGEHPSSAFWPALACMAAGVWLHLSEHHQHPHDHDPMSHTHAHVHDDHHRHEHEAGWDGREPHSHYHRHVPLFHAHPHFPDIHHRHSHDTR